MSARLEVMDEFVLASESLTDDAARAPIEMAMEARRHLMFSLDVSAQVAGAGVALAAAVIDALLPLSSVCRGLLAVFGSVDYGCVLYGRLARSSRIPANRR
jgi:hypothetical protein